MWHVTMSNNNKKILKASAYYLEDVLGLELDARSSDGKITFLSLNQPPICDAHCRRCFMPDDRRNRGENYSLSLQESKDVLAGAREYGAMCLEISGEGEPVLSRKLFEIIKHADSLGYLTTLITNGHNLTEEQIALCEKSNVTLLFSHHSLDESVYERDNSTPGSFDKKMRNLEIASKLYKGSPKKLNEFLVYRLGIHATLQKDNVGDIVNLRDYCHERNIFFSIAPVAQTGSALNHPEMKLEEMVYVNDQAVSLDDAQKLLGDNSIIHSHSSSREVEREVCGTCFYGLNVGYDGAVLFDAHAGYEIGDVLGNVKDTDFSELIRRQKSISKELFENIQGFCPVRDPEWHNFMKKFINKEITI